MVSLKPFSFWTTETEKNHNRRQEKQLCYKYITPHTGWNKCHTESAPLSLWFLQLKKRDLKVNIQFLSTAGHFLGRLAGSRLKWITRLSRWFTAWVSGRDAEGGWGFQQPALISWQMAFLLRRSTWAESSSQWLRPYAELSLLWPGSSAGSSA